LNKKIPFVAIFLLLAAAALAGCASDAPATGGMTNACANLPPLPWAFQAEAGPPASEDFTWDNDGYFLGLSKNNIIRLAHGGTPALVWPNVAITGTGIRALPNGDIAVADEVRGSVIRINAAGDRTNLGANIRSPNGLALGPNRRLFLTDRTGGNLYLVDPATAASTLLTAIADDVDGLAFSPDYRTLYVGAYGTGELYKLPFTAGAPSGMPALFAQGLTGADGLTTDECGNIYVAGYRDGTLKRVTPDGKIELVAQLDTRSASAVNFGSGRQGWDAQTIYVMNYNDGGLFAIKTPVRGAPAP
jgi:gluconolactonase